VSEKRDFWKDITGETFEEWTRIPTFEEILDKQRKSLKSKYPLRILGSGQGGTLYISEEERESHLHILGTTGEGKSRLIEHLIRGDIEQGNGVCLLDPTDRAETAYNILRYCAKIGFEKVCLIDPHTVHSLNRISCLQPFHYEKSYRSATVANLMDTIRILFQTKDAAETPRIQRYLGALLNVLWQAEMTLHEAIYFTEYKHSTPRRKEILNHSDPLDRHRLILEEVFETYYRFNTEFASTVRRLEPFFDSTLDLMYGGDRGIDFNKMITEGWVILVNLYSGLGFEPIHTRLLGTTVINELIFALDRLKNRGWKGAYYLYIDECGRYANRNLADLLAYKRKTGLRVTVAHQYFKQFEDSVVLDAVKNMTKIKVMFNTPNYGDRLEMVKALGYGGDIPPLMASYANSDLPKQYAIIKSGKQAPVRVKIPDVSDIKLEKKVETAFIGKCLTHEWNFSPQEIKDQMKRRFYESPRTQTNNPQPPRPRTQADRKPDSPTRVPDKGSPGNKWKAVSQNLPVSPEHVDEDGGTEGS
jgi:hypothetical protein